MKARVLPVAEWDRLVATEFPHVLPYLGPEDARIVVVEDGDEIVGCWGLMPMWHVEGLWVSPAYRHTPSVFRRLFALMRREIQAVAPRWLMTGAQDDVVAELLTKHAGAVKVPMEQYMIRTQGDQRCHWLR